MTPAAILAIGILLSSALFCALTLHEFRKVSMRREKLLNALGSDQGGTVRSRYALSVAYGITSLLWTMLIVVGLLQIAS